MNWLSGNVSFVRYRPDCLRPRAFDDTHLLLLTGRQIGRQRVAGADGVECGWAAGGHVLDTDFRLEKNVYPDHLLWDLLVRTDKLPPDLLRAYYAVELKALTKDNPSGFPSARQKREAKEAARDRLEAEARDGRFVKRKQVPALWDSLTNAVFVGSTSGPECERFERLYRETFGADLRPVTAGTLAASIDPRAGDAQLSEFVPGATPEDGPAWQADADGPPDFLGNEFVLWLWFHTATESDTVGLPDGTEATFMFSGGLNVEDPKGQHGRATLNDTSAIRMSEAQVAARNGKLPRKAALTVVRNDDQFSFVLAAETLAVTSAKLPKAPDDVTGRAAEEHRLQMVRDLAEAIDQLYAAFLARRLASSWTDELRDVQAWLRRAGDRRKLEA